MTMNTVIRILLAAGLCLLADPAAAQKRPYPPELPDAREEIYRTTEEAVLRLWVFEPPNHQSSDSRPAVVFFFGGGWNGGSPAQFAPQSRQLAERGMVAMVADYRVRSRNGTLANIAVSDAKAAIRWVRANADRLGVDPDRIAAAGGSAGGHLAAATATLPSHDDSNDGLNISSQPNALLLFNPVLITAPFAGQAEPATERFEKLKPRLGAEPESMSPYHHVRPGLPPTIVFHGEADKTVPYQTAELFTEAMRTAGNRCELVGYPGEGHGFFNSGRGIGSAYTDTMRRTDAFLVSLGWLASKSPHLKLMTFNLRYGLADDGDHDWQNRSPGVIQVLQEEAPDIFGVQEALRFQMDFINDQLPAYQELGEARDGGTQGEYSALFFDPVRFEAIRNGTFWFSDTPDQPSQHWGNRFNRICTWAEFLDRQSQQTFYVFNVHWDHESQESRDKSAAMLTGKMVSLVPAGTPFFAMGDFNAGEENSAILYLRSAQNFGSHQAMIDTFRQLHPNDSNVGTIHHFSGDDQGDKIDYVFMSPAFPVVDARIIKSQYNGLYPSDHFPVVAEIVLKD